jgi:hypothetical protein
VQFHQEVLPNGRFVLLSIFLFNNGIPGWGMEAFVFLLFHCFFSFSARGGSNRWTITAVDTLSRWDEYACGLDRKGRNAKVKSVQSLSYFMGGCEKEGSIGSAFLFWHGCGLLVIIF